MTNHFSDLFLFNENIATRLTEAKNYIIRNKILLHLKLKRLNGTWE